MTKLKFSLEFDDAELREGHYRNVDLTFTVDPGENIYSMVELYMLFLEACSYNTEKLKEKIED